MPNPTRLVPAVVIFLIASSALCDSENLVRNSGFEAATDGRPDHWSVYMAGEWVGYGRKASVAPEDIVAISTDGRTGEQALVIDTLALNPSGKITDELRTWNHPKYEIRLTQRVGGIKPNSWYLVKFQIKSPQILVDTGFQLLADLKPFPYPIIRLESFGKTRWGRQTIEGRPTLAFAPMPDGEYREYAMLVETMDQSESLEVGVRIRAPWTGKIIIDDVEVTQVDPARDMTRMEKLLALRAAKPIREVRQLNRQTTLVDNGIAEAVLLVGDSDVYKDLAAKIQERVAKLTGSTLPIVTKAQDVGPDKNIVAIGNMMNNDLVARLHFNRYVKVNATSPGPGGYVIWSVPEPYGLAKKQNVIVVAGSDAAGEAAAVDAFCKLLTAKNKTIKLPFLHTVFPERKLTAEDRKVSRKSWGMGGYYAGFSKWFIQKWLDTGDLEAARLARKEMLRGVERFLDNPYAHEKWAGWEVALAWDALEEIPVFSDEDRLAITNWLLGYLHARPMITADWTFMAPHLNKNTPTWNHQAKGLAGMYTMGRYFNRFYDDHDARFDHYIGTARNAFQQQAQWWKPEENSENYTRLTIDFSLAYYLGEWDLTFFENESMRRYARHFAAFCNNEGWCSGFGDTYYCYVGWKGGYGFGPSQIELALWYYKDGRFLWWLKHIKPDYRSPYHRDVEPIEWRELVGIKKTPLERGNYDPNSRLELWGADGEGAEGPVGDIKYSETFDKISFRENWDRDGQYMLLEGLGRGIHSGHATNQICKLSILGEDLLIGTTYIGNDVRTGCSVIVAKDSDIDDPAVKGKDLGPARGQKARWRPIARKYPAYAALDAMADLPNSGFTRTSMRDFLGGTDWHRNIFWVKGKYFALIDEVVVKEAGTYYVESNLRTHPTEAGRWTKGIKPRKGEVLPDNRGYEMTVETPRKTKLYILTDRTASITTAEAPARSIKTVMVRQVHKARKLEAGEKVTYINLLYGDREGERANYRIERLSPTEGLIFSGDKPVAYFGCSQSDKTRAIFPIEARMFLLSEQMLAVVDGTSAGEFFKSETPISREVQVPAETVAKLLQALSE